MKICTRITSLYEIIKKLMLKKSILGGVVKSNKMSNKIEECLAALTQIITQNQGTGGFRSRIEAEIRYIPIFDGAHGTLTSFKDAVDRVLLDHSTEKIEVFKIIYNLKIQGAAKNILAVEPPENWEQCKKQLQSHFRPSRDQFQITRDINELKVRSIFELDSKITQLIEDLTELAAHSDNKNTITTIFSSMLIQKIKELTVGALSYAISNIYCLTEIRNIVRNFIGQDEYNLKMNNITQQRFKSHVSNQVRTNSNNTQFAHKYQNQYGNRPEYHHHNRFNNGSGNHSFRQQYNNNNHFNNFNNNFSGHRNYNTGPSFRSGENNNQNNNRIISNSQQTRQSFMDVDNIAKSNDNAFFTN